MKKTAIFCLAVLITLSACLSKKEKENTLSFSGAFALYPLVIKWAEIYKKENPEVRFNISAGGAGKGMADALGGTVDLGMFSREITQPEKDKGVWWVGLCKDAVFPTISADHPYLKALKLRGMTKDEFQAVFIEGTITNWNELLTDIEPLPIQVYTRSDACGAAGTWAKYLGGKQEGLNGVGIHGDPGLAEAVGKNPAGIAYNNTAFIYDINTGKKHPGIEVIPIDLNENGKTDPEENFYDEFDKALKAIADKVYPSPPARELYFVAKGKPEKKATLDFIKWTLTSGQEYVKSAGYVPISDEKLKDYLSKVN
jgi:phosphate transport system substrate-binding protein